MNSPHQREQLPDLLSDALEPAERARVESHLAGCEQCARELRALQRMQQTLATLTAEAPPDRIRANVRAALRADKKQRWAFAAFRGNRARNGVRKALPFVLPARQLAWGGAVALSAVGLMLLARPSLQNDPMGQQMPASETELATRATAAPSTADNSATRSVAKAPAAKAPAAKAPAAKAPGTKIKGNVKRNPTASAPDSVNGASSRPDGQADLPMLPTPQQPLPRLARPESPAPIPEIKTPSPELFPESAPTPAQKASANQPKNRPDAPDSTTKPAAPAQPAPAPLGRAAMPKQAPPTPKSDEQNDLASTQSQTNPELEAANSNARASDSASDAAANVQSKSAGNAPAAFAPPPMALSPAPAVSAPAASRKMTDSDGWAGGAVSASLKRGGNQSPVLTLSVDIAIGDARLFLLLPSGETQVWRGAMNAAPIAIKLPNFAGKVSSGQKIRARLEQIDGEGNPKGSTTFTLVWP